MPSAGPSRPPIAPPHSTIPAAWLWSAGGSCQSRVSSPRIVYSSRWRSAGVSATCWLPMTCSASKGVVGDSSPCSSDIAATYPAVAVQSSVGGDRRWGEAAVHALDAVDERREKAGRLAGDLEVGQPVED